MITRQGTKANHLFVLLKGRARYFVDTPDSHKILLMWVVPGGVIGAGAVSLKLVNYIASAETVRDSVMLCWTRATIRGLAQLHPRLLDNGLTIAAEYIAWSIETLVGLTSQTAQERLAHVLLGLSRMIGQQVSGGMELDVTNEELASAANITPYTTSRLLGQWQKRELVRKYRGRIMLCAPEKLLFHVI